MTPGRFARLAPLVAPAALLGAAAVRFHDYLLGGSVVSRDAGFFFVPLREVTARLLSAGQPPLWNDASGAGRALAANPNAAVFWPGTWLVPVVGTTGLFLLHVGLVLLLAFAALRWLGVSRGGALAGGVLLLFSGVFQTVPLLTTTVASAAPLPLALVALGTLDPSDARGTRRRLAVAGLSLGLSLLGGEPVVTAIGAAGAASLALVRAGADAASGRWRHARNHLAVLAASALLSAGIAAVQLLPTAGELGRSARARTMRAEEGALFWSVRPSRLLTLLEPRLTGDPQAEDDRDYWGAPVFDAGNPTSTTSPSASSPFSSPRRPPGTLAAGRRSASRDWRRSCRSGGSSLRSERFSGRCRSCATRRSGGFSRPSASAAPRPSASTGCATTKRRRGGSPGPPSFSPRSWPFPRSSPWSHRRRSARSFEVLPWRAPASARNGRPRCSGRSFSRASPPSSCSRSCRGW
ncbi:MAG: hypothetical protein IPN83_16730 [Holophagales bacterium]|nr:hypothetical protein [Holophagales bacterium]